MATTTYILSIDDFTNRADLSANIKQNILNQYAGITQEKFGKKALCKETYDEIIDQLAQGGESYLTPEYQTLLPFLKDYLVYKTMERYYTNANYKSTPAGIREHTDTISTKAPNTAMSTLTKQANSDAEYYFDELLNFLQDNEDDYPLWKSSVCNCNSFSTGTGKLRFGGKRTTKVPIKWT